MSSINVGWAIVMLLLSGRSVETQDWKRALSESSRQIVHVASIEWGLERLSALMQTAGSREIRFEETHVSQLLTEPLVSKGILTFHPPDHLAKHVLVPHEERYRIDGAIVSWDKAGQAVPRVIDLEDYPVLHMFVVSLRKVFTGDLVGLTQWFTLELKGMEKAWHLTLTPLDSTMREFVSSLEVSGRAGTITTVMVQEANGDYTVMQLMMDAG